MLTEIGEGSMGVQGHLIDEEGRERFSVMGMRETNDFGHALSVRISLLYSCATVAACFLRPPFVVVRSHSESPCSSCSGGCAATVC